MTKAYILPVCLMLLVASAGSVAAQMDPQPDQQCLMVRHSSDTDDDFVHDMLQRHQMAIDLAQRELLQGKNPAAREMAQKMLYSEIKEIGQMEDWLKAH
jgi:uncharacterized protein (DUF305 family)